MFFLFVFFFAQESREEHLDRGTTADCIQKFLATLEARVHKLGQLWTLREEQLNKNRQLSAEFVQFEKDTREVMTLCWSYCLICTCPMWLNKSTCISFLTIIGSCVSVRSSRYEACRKFGEHESCVRVA